jgi:biopolymer transport protein ExbD
MIRRRFRKQQACNGEESGALDISSLIEVSFLLLIYFLITSNLDPKEGNLNLTMPPPGVTADPDAPVMPNPRIVVDAAGVVSMQDEVLDTDPEVRKLIHLEDRLLTYGDAYRVFDTEGSPPIEVEVADVVPGQRFIDLMNCLAGLEIKNFNFVDFGSNY